MKFWGDGRSRKRRTYSFTTGPRLRPVQTQTQQSSDPSFPSSPSDAYEPVTVEVELVSDTSNRGGSNDVANGTAFLAKDIPIPVGSSVELLSGNKVVLEAGDKIRIDCSVADKLSGSLSVMEIT